MFMAETADSLSDVTVRKQKVSGFSQKQQFVNFFYYQQMHKRIFLRKSLNFDVNLNLCLRLLSCAPVGKKKLIIVKMHGMNVKKNNNMCCYLYFYLDNMFRSVDHNQVIFTKFTVRCM